VRFGWAFPPVAVVAVVLEIGAPLVLIGRRARDLWVGLSWAMHLAIALTMYIVFPYPLFVVAFAPLYDLEKLGSAAASKLRTWQARRRHSSRAR
jgi:hypothetical protein